jgi:hypothetical protein
MVVFRKGGIRPIEQFHIFEIESSPSLLLAIIQGEGMHSSSEKRVDLDRIRHPLTVSSEMVGRMVLLVPFQGLQEEVETALLHFRLIFLQFSQALGRLTDLRQHLTNINNIK